MHTRRKSLIRVAVLIVAFAAAACPVRADAPTPIDPTQLKLTVTRAVVFKDGYALIVKHGTATTDAGGRVYTDQTPDAAVLGTFWAMADAPEGEPAPTLAARAEWVDDDRDFHENTPAVTILELLRANVGQKVTLGLTDKTDKGDRLTVAGALREVLDLPPEPAPKLTLEAAGTVSREIVPRGGELAVIETDAGRSIIPVDHVLTITGPQLVTTIDRHEEKLTRSKRLSFDFGHAAAGKDVGLRFYYFTPGLNWTPTYRVSGKLEDHGDLILQADVYNDLQDLSGATLDLVVGYPNFRFKNVSSALVLEAAARQLMIQYAANAYTGNTNINAGALTIQGGGGVQAMGGTVVPDIPTIGEQDLYVYSVKDFDLKKGARSTVPLREDAIAVRHLYTADLTVRRVHPPQVQEQMPQQVDKAQYEKPSASPLQVSINPIWHQLELTNNTAGPWTAGAAVIMDDALPLGQDLLTYTPVGARAMLPITIAVDLRAACDEDETFRQINAITVDGENYMLIKKHGKVTLTSFRKDKSSMRITLALGGKVWSTSDNGVIKLGESQSGDWDDPASMRVNHHSDITWELPLGPGETKTLTYEVSFFLR